MQAKRRILIVGPLGPSRQEIVESLGDGFSIRVVDSSNAAARQIREEIPHLVLVDLKLGSAASVDLCRKVKQGPLGNRLQLIVLASHEQRAAHHELILAGADDVLPFPIQESELLARLRLHARLQQSGAQCHPHVAYYRTESSQPASHRPAGLSRLNSSCQPAEPSLPSSEDLLVFALARLAESRDPETGEHLLRMRAYAQIVADQLSRVGPYTAQIDEFFLESLFRCSPLHDVGKVAVADRILLKPGKLSSAEFRQVQKHTLRGSQVFEDIIAYSPDAGFLEMARDIARSHHERFDGGGYPDGLAGQEIPLAARIVAVADVFDALTSTRAYKDAYPADEAREMIQDESGTHFDPAIVAALQQRWSDILQAQSQLTDEMPITVGAASFLKGWTVPLPVTGI